MKKWVINNEDFDEEYPPRLPYPFSHKAAMNAEQVELLNSKITSSSVFNGGPATGKTVLAIMKTTRLILDGKKCLLITLSSLSSKYIKHIFRSIGICEDYCMSYREFEISPHSYDFILLDDSDHYTLEQIQKIKIWSDHQILFGNYDHSMLHDDGKAMMPDICRILNCSTYSLYKHCGVPEDFRKLTSHCTKPLTISNSSLHSQLPTISRIGSIEKQCRKVKEILERTLYENVGILCYTRSLVKTTYAFLKEYGLPVEVYLPRTDDGIDTIDFNSGNPKILTIASSIGLHFRVLFVIGFDKDVIWKDPEHVIEIITTRPTENLYIFYENQLPDALASLPLDLYISNLRERLNTTF